MKRPKTTTDRRILLVRLDPIFFESVHSAAKAQGRTLTVFVTRALEKALQDGNSAES